MACSIGHILYFVTFDIWLIWDKAGAPKEAPSSLSTVVTIGSSTEKSSSEYISPVGFGQILSFWENVNPISPTRHKKSPDFGG